MRLRSVLGLEFEGVEGRSSWGRMLTADAFSAVICATVVNGLKYSIKTERPDGSKRNSFPSGHTTVAFMTATMLHKEYGETRSYWYSVFGYGVAMATGISRQFNNRHWVSDVMFGAGLGILSTELGYFLAELIFKDKGIVKDKKSFKSFNTNNKPSYISFGVGTTFFAKINSISINNYYNLSDGVSASLEGAYFFNKYIGVMGKWTAMNCRIQINDYIFKERLNTYAFQTGPQFSFPISDKWLVGAYADIGYCKVPKYNIIMDHLDKNSGAIWGFGTNITYLMHRRLGIRGTFDYVNLPTIKWPNALCRNAVTTYMSACFMF